MERAFKKMIRNYLPNIQVIVPSNIQFHLEPTNSNTIQPPTTQQTLNQTQGQKMSRPVIRSSFPIQNNYSNITNNFEEAVSVN